MESLLAYSSGSDSEETEQGKGREESVKKRKVTEMNKRDQNYLGDRNTRQLANKRPKPFLQSPDECKAVGIFSNLKQTASIIPQMSRSDHCGLSNDFNESSLSHVQAPSGRIDEKFVPSVISTMHRKFSSTSVSGSVNAKPYISKRERQELSQQKTTRPLSVSPVTFPLKPQLEGAEFISSSKEDDEGIRKNKKQVTSRRPPKQLLVSFEGHSQGVNCVRWHPSRSNLLLSASMDHSVCVWDTLGDAICLKLTHHTAAVKDGKWSLCGSQVLSCGYDKTARLVNLETGQEIVKFPHRNYVTSVQFHPTDSTLFLAGTFKSSILCWDARTGKISATYSACFGQVQDIAFLPHGNEFISAAEVIRRNSTDKGIMVWDFRSTAVLSNQIYQEAFTCTCLKVHPSESHFVAQSNGDYIALFSTKKPYKLNKFKRYEGHKVSGYHIGCDFSPGGSIICSGSADGHIYFYDHHSSHMISKLKAHSMPCMDVVFHPSLPHCVASCGWDGGVKIWK